MTNRKIPLSVAIGVSALLTACAGSPQNEMVSEARSSYQAINQDPNVARSGASDLRAAKEHLERAEELLEDGADEELVEHEAYLAKQHAEVAATRGERSAIQQEIEAAESRRDELRLQARTAQARQAQSAAQRAQNEAQLAQQEAQELRRQMQELKEMQAQQTDRGMVLTLGDVLFDLNKATLQAAAEDTITNLADFLKKYEERRVRVEGYTDSTGSEAYNQQLSEERARSVQEALISQGIDSSRVEIRGYGEAYPVASNEDSSGRARNRRVEIVISDENGNIQGR